MSDPLNPQRLIDIVRSSLTNSNTGSDHSTACESSTSPVLLKNPYDALAILCHACMLAVGFRFVGLGEDGKFDTPFDAADVKPLPQSWNSTTPSLHEFRYTHTQSSLTFLIKLSRLGPKVMIYGMGLGDDKPATYSVIAKEYTSENFFPYPSNSSEEPLQNGYVSFSRLKDFAGLFKLNVLQKIIPGLHKAGYEEASSDLQEPRTSASTSEIVEPLRPQPYGDPGFDPLRTGIPRGAGGRPNPGPYVPGFDDEHEIFSGPAHPRQGPFGGINPFSIGHDDLNPPGLGSNPSLTGPFFGGGNSPLPRPGMGGMHPTADHPLFGGRGGDYGDERPANAPPGARWDPVGPGNGRFGLPRGPRGPFGGSSSGFPGGGFL